MTDYIGTVRIFFADNPKRLWVTPKEARQLSNEQCEPWFALRRAIGAAAGLDEHSSLALVRLQEHYVAFTPSKSVRHDPVAQNEIAHEVIRLIALSEEWPNTPFPVEIYDWPRNTPELVEEFGKENVFLRWHPVWH